MHKDAHYYATLAFARAAGLNRDDAVALAHAAQFVDDACVNQIELESVPKGVETDDIGGCPGFINMATCHDYSRLNTFSYSAMVNNTCAFHFVPGCEGEGFVQQLRCKEASPVVLALMEEAVEIGDPVRLGMVAHAFVDTFAHQGFSGLLSKVNDIRGLRPHRRVRGELLEPVRRLARRWLEGSRFERYFDRLVPAYGHGQAMSYPDLPYLTWEYAYDDSSEFSGNHRSTGTIDNPERYRRAFRALGGHLKRYLERHPERRDHSAPVVAESTLLDILLAPGSNHRREQRWRSRLVELGLLAAGDEALKYDRHRWPRQAFIDFHPGRYTRRRVKGALPAPDFFSSRWYAFYRGVKWYKERFFHHCSRNGLELPRK